MHKEVLLFVCQSCGSTQPRWQGKCSACGEWNTIVEEIEFQTKKKSTSLKKITKSQPIPINEVPQSEAAIFSSGLAELDHVLGKGFVEGSIVLLGGEPGIGKSTLALQIANTMANRHSVLYISGEESAPQIQLRAARLGALNPHLNVLIETNLHHICDIITRTKPKLVIVDSIQVVFHPEIPSIPGSVNQVRHGASVLSAAIKEVDAVGVVIGHITKDGALAGPKVLEHLVDVILVLDGERADEYRTVRSYKNRFASTNEIGLFELNEKGLKSIENPYILGSDFENARSGSVVSSITEGSRAFLLEVQALVVHSGYGMAKRTFLGVDPNRAYLLIAALEKIAGIKLGDKDIILNIVGGLKSSDPALDLAFIFAMVSSLYDKPLNRVGICGEISLTGEIRAVKQIEKRVIEWQRMGVTTCIVPGKNKVSFTEKEGIKTIYVESLQGALELISKL